MFIKTRNTAITLAVKLNSDGVKCELLGGQLDIDQRAAFIDRFRNGNTKLLITTNVVAVWESWYRNKFT